ncbi:MAG TPA: 16S rRNA (cytosine(1402)-N(4))-methyltransferase RsmH [Chloroflexota bacterium]|nr:16S rRNA (cytosine(1402)-N(4))-methyltransferase RsmH [Chloroflexota bacterium]
MIAVEHVPVLYREALEGLALRPGGRYIDATAGSGGHAAGILEGSAPDGTVLALDTDAEAVARAAAALHRFGSRARLVQANFRDLRATATREGWDVVDGILFDLGVSSVQLGTPMRGFSFQDDGPLDMRMDSSQGITAAEVVNRWTEADLARILRDYGEEPLAARIAAAIVRERARSPFASTAQLADLVARVKGRRGRIHPATMVFQALRIAVNGELESIAVALPQAIDLLRHGGRLAVIAFHSLEDRLVKRFMQEQSKECRCPPAQLICTCARRPALRVITRHAVMASSEEIAHNPRARSARLRVAERLCYAEHGEIGSGREGG